MALALPIRNRHSATSHAVGVDVSYESAPAFLRWGTALAVLGGYLGLAAGAVISPDMSDGGSEKLLSAATAHPDRLTAYAVVNVAYITLLALGMLGLFRIMRGPRTRLILVAAGLIAVGLIGHVAEVCMDLTLVAVAKHPLATHAGMVQLIHHIGQYLTPMLGFLAPFLLGLPLLMAGLWRAGRIRGWVAILFLAGLAFGFLPIPGDGNAQSIGFYPPYVIGSICFVLAAAGIAHGTGTSAEHGA